MSEYIDDVKTRACSAGRVSELWNKCWFVFQRPHKNGAGGKRKREQKRKELSSLCEIWPDL